MNDVAEGATGTYYLRIYRGAATSTPYTLKVKAAGETEKNTWQRASNLGTLRSRAVARTSRIGELDVNDWFKFTTRGTRALTLALTGLTADLDLSLFNAAGTLIEAAAADGAADDVITGTLTAGVYYARVCVPGLTSLDATLNYTLRMIAPLA